MEGPIVWPQVPPPGFADIVDILWQSQLPLTMLEPIEEQAPTPVVGPTLFVSRMIQDAWGNLSVDMVTCHLSMMSMGCTPMAMVSEMPNLEDAPEFD